MTAPAARAGGVTVSVEAIAWVAATALFLGLRFAVTWQAPVGGEELPALSGAWQAAHGVDGSRFIPTLFQAASSVLLLFSDSEVPSRVLAFVATATLPLAFFLLRPVLGLAGALVALVVAALDGPAIYFGVAATVSGFDLAIVTWLFVLLVRPELRSRLHPALAAIPGFLAATGGALLLPFLLAAVAVHARSFGREPLSWMGYAAAGAIAGIAAATVGFGFGWQGVTVPPLLAFSRTFGNDVTTLTAFDAWSLYAWPVAVAGLIAVALVLAGWRANWPAAPGDLLLIAWSLVAALFAAAALNAHSVASLPALTLPLALVLGPALVRAVGAIRHADWAIPRFTIPAGALLAGVALAFAADWARQGSVGDDAEVARVVALVSAGAAAFAVAAVERRSRPALLVPGLGLGAIVLVVGAFGIGLSGQHEPLPSPVSTTSARALRALAIEARSESGGSIVVHPDFVDDVTWPFRDSGDLRVASRVPTDAVIVLWPPRLPQPEGFAVLEGDWSLRDDVHPPTADALDLLRWYIDRNRLETTNRPLAVYIKSD